MNESIHPADDVRALVDRLLGSARSAATNDPTSRVMFYNAATRSFGEAWTAANPGTWLFPLSQPAIDPGPSFIYHVCRALATQLSLPVKQVLITGKAAAALFWAAPDAAAQDSPNVVGPLPKNSLAVDFGSTIAMFASAPATITLLGDSIAADGTYDGTLYKGVDFISTISLTLGGYCLASDQPVTRNPDGTAVTTGNIWQADPNGDFVNKYPAPGGGQTQPFPLAPVASASASERRIV
ncbi:MAG TPA: hypothetical protein VHL59_10430 [Thermoanaerobaculia bacterium]|nr:hypothetical protein [Thermoanaerobaculia bacterium]